MGVVLKWLSASARDFFSGFVGSPSVEVAGRRFGWVGGGLIGEGKSHRGCGCYATRFSRSLGFSRIKQLRVSDIVPARQKIPAQTTPPPPPHMKRSGCHCPDGISPRGTLNRTFIELIIE